MANSAMISTGRRNGHGRLADIRGNHTEWRAGVPPASRRAARPAVVRAVRAIPRGEDAPRLAGGTPARPRAAALYREVAGRGRPATAGGGARAPVGSARLPFD